MSAGRRVDDSPDADATSPAASDAEGTSPAQPAHVVLLGTGGTIAGSHAADEDVAYHSGALTVEEILDAVPQVGELARISAESLAHVGSQDVDETLWLQLAAACTERLGHPGVNGIVITHGTDTLEETAWFLQLVLRADQPVVLTGAMRPATGLGADGPRNVLDAVRVAVDPGARGRGVLAVLDESIFDARGIHKTNTTYVSSFKAPNFGPAGAIVAGRPMFFRPPAEHGLRGAFDLGVTDRLPRVDVLFAHAGMRPDLVHAAVDAGAEGLVVAGVGNGNVPSPVCDALAEVARRGVLVVRGSRVGSGFVTRNVEIDDDAHGFVAALDLSPHKARILLQLALLETKDPEVVQALFSGY